MNSKEIDSAMRNRMPVIYDGIRYKRILEYVSWYDKNGNHKLSVVLLAKQGNYSVKVDAAKIEYIEKL